MLKDLLSKDQKKKLRRMERTLKEHFGKGSQASPKDLAVKLSAENTAEKKESLPVKASAANIRTKSQKPLDKEKRELPAEADNVKKKLKAAKNGKPKKEKKEKTYEKAVIEKIVRITGWTEEYTADEIKRVQSKFGLPLMLYDRERMFLWDDMAIQSYLDRQQKKDEVSIEKVIRKSGWSREEVLKQMRHAKERFRLDPVHYHLFECWKYTDQELSELANWRQSAALSNQFNTQEAISILRYKDQFNIAFGEFLGRKWWFNRNTDYGAFLRFIEGIDRIFCKPTDSSSGRGMEILPVPEDLQTFYEDLIRRPEMLCEEVVVQHPELNRLNPGSVNTIRAIVLRRNDRTEVLWTCMRIGRYGIVDDPATGGGGFVVNINKETGVICTDAIDRAGDVYEVHPLTGTRFKGLQIPYWKELLELVDRGMQVIPGLNYVGWDVAVTPSGPIFIEGNGKPDLGLCQFSVCTTGERLGPYFNRFLQEASVVPDRAEAES